MSLRCNLSGVVSCVQLKYVKLTIYVQRRGNDFLNLLQKHETEEKKYNKCGWNVNLGEFFGLLQRFGKSEIMPRYNIKREKLHHNSICH